MEPVSLGLLHDGDMSTYSSTCSSRKSSSQVSQDAEFFELFETINKCGLDMEQVMIMEFMYCGHFLDSHV